MLRIQAVDHIVLVVDDVEHSLAWYGGVLDLDAVRDSGAFGVVEGPVTRWRAQGDGTSLYVKDPDGNVVELCHSARTGPS